MAEVPDTVDDAINELSDTPTTDEVFFETLPFQAREIASAAVSMAAAAGGGGGAVVATVTEDVVTDSVTFHYSHIFDLGHASAVTVTAQLIAFTGDGETLGSAPGDVQLAVGADTSADGSTYLNTSPVAGSAFYPDKTLRALSSPGLLSFASARYLRVQGDWEDSNFDEYAGPNNPFGTIRISVQYV